ncbi:MAG: DUF2202 domain-containing protein [Methylocystaceae bacterium]|nr:DUF2202 domain-containing protein [Methylocystaceae bacterium]
MSNSLEHVLCEALDDEYKARATYQAVLETFGDVRPFTNIVHAEDRHAKALEQLFARYGFAIPKDRWPEKIKLPEKLEDCVKLAVEAEIENADMYDRLLAQTSDYPDVQRVLLNLQRASQENHLPAFQRALERSSSLTAEGCECGCTNESGQGQGRGNANQHRNGNGHSCGCGNGRGHGHGHGRRNGNGRGRGCASTL